VLRKAAHLFIEAFLLALINRQCIERNKKVLIDEFYTWRISSNLYKFSDSAWGLGKFAIKWVLLVDWNYPFS